jgi:hypothetical protein
MESIGKNGSIAERLALLKSNGENNWRKRVVKKEISEEIIKKENIVEVSLGIEKKIGVKKD